MFKKTRLLNEKNDWKLVLGLTSFPDRLAAKNCDGEPGSVMRTAARLDV